jgi:nicotinate dehydrogenase subunit B
VLFGLDVAKVEIWVADLIPEAERPSDDAEVTRFEDDGTLTAINFDGSHVQRGRGIALKRYKSDGAYVAIAADVEVRKTIKVVRCHAVVDCGEIIDRKGVISQIRGAIIQAISWTLKEQVWLASNGDRPSSWSDYPVLSFNEVPEIDVYLTPGNNRHPSGVGELPTGATSAAIANAIARATGLRIRDPPITTEKLEAAAYSSN